MALTSGIPLVDLFELADTIESVLPAAVRSFIERFVVVGHTATHSDGAIFHRGSLQPIATAIAEIPTDFNIGIGRLSLPLLQTGIPFQLAFQRAAVAGTLEPGAQAWRLDLSLDVFTLTVDRLRPAIYVPEVGTTPRHLVRDPARSSVRITGSAVLRIEKTSPTASVDVKFVDAPDPFDPAAVSGAVATLTCSPPHFFIGDSEYGLSVGRLQFDFSETYSTPEVLARRQGPSWMGVAIREATFYAPRNLPGLGDLSGGVKNVLIGSPIGLQGELEIQFGRTAMNPASFQFEQKTEDGDLSLGTGGSGLERTVTIEASEGADVTIRAGFVAPGPPDEEDVPAGGLQDWSAEWTWPNGTSQTADSSTGIVRHGQVLRVTPIETVTVDDEDTEFRHPEITFRFVAAGTGPTITARAGSETFANTVHIGGTAAAVGGVTLTAVTGGTTAGTFEWQIEGLPAKTAGETYTPAVAGLVGFHTVILREKVTLPGQDEQERLARLRLQILETGGLIVGCEAGVFAGSDDGTRLALAAVEDTFDLSDFHAGGALNAKLEAATIDAADASSVHVPADGLARVTLAGPPPTVVERDRHVQILMEFDQANERSWGAARPAGSNGAFLQTRLLEWAARYPGAQFIVVGRCDDIGSDSYNQTLARDRAARGVRLLTTREAGAEGTVVSAASVVSRGEQDSFTGTSASGNSLEEDSDLGLDAAEKSESVAGSTHGRLIHAEVPESTGWPESRYVDGNLSPHEGTRDDYRRVDIYAVGGTPTADSALVTEEPVVGATLRRSMVPAPGRDPAPVTAGSPSLDYRVKLRIVWDSPTVSELKDAIPTLAEAEFAWTPQSMPLPAVNGQDVELSREVLTVFVNWAHDARTGYTKASLGIRSEGDPDGLISTTTGPLIAALAFGPALLSGVNSQTDLIGSGARIAALIAVIGFAEVDLGGGPLIGDGSKVALTSAAFETEMRSISDPGPDMQVRVVTDYVCTLHINGGALGIKTAPDQPMKIRYKRVGLQYDTSKEGWNRFGLVYDSSSMEIEDPGRWQIDGVLGSLLRIVEVAIGRGSIWFEGRIAIALEIGIIEISEAIIRLTFHEGSPIPAFELRGFVLKADVSGVFQGEGRLRIEDGGLIRAGVEANIIPVGIGVEAALAMAKRGTPENPWMFLSLYLGVQFSTPLPLAQSGLAIYGFKGLFTMNGTRLLPPSNPDPVLRELDWWATPPESKYEPQQGQFALGVGVVVGTMPDASFCVSCAGMLVVAFPDIEVILGVDVSIIEVPETTASDEGGSSGTITGLIVIDDEAVKLAVSAQYTIPKVLAVRAPFAGYFPYPGQGKNVYVRIGSDGQTQFARYGEPVTLTLLPDTLDAQAWTYLMIEQGGLPSLGGDPRFSFEGFSVGFGAGFGIDWSAGPIALGASAKILVGFGTAPLMLKGGIFVAGELDLVVISIAARGELVLEAREFKKADGSQDVAIKIDGEFCGEVDLFFFSISGCVGVSIDNNPDMIPPAPPSPVKGISLTDRRDRIMGVATTATPAAARVFVAEDPSAGAAVDTNNTVWPDTAPVIHFSHYVENAMGSGAQFAPGPTPTQDKWFGSSELKYAYRLDNVILRRASDDVIVSGAKPLQSTWMSTPYRQPDASGESGVLPSEHEGPNLKLLDWNPWTWVVNMDSGGAGQPGDPVDTVENVCEPKPVPHPACVLGRTARRAGFNKVRMRATQPAPGPYPSRFFVAGEPVVRVGTQALRGRPLQSLITLAGGQIVPGAVVTMPFAADVHGTPVDRGYKLPLARRVAAGAAPGLLDIALPWEGRYSQRLTDPSVTLLICDAPSQGTPPGDGGADEGRCDDFRGLKASGAVKTLQRPTLTIAVDGGELALVDRVDQRVSPVVQGTDGSAELQFPEKGTSITLNAPTDRLELHLVPASEVRAEALAADGRVLAAALTTGPMDSPQVLVLRASGIAAARLTGGAGKSLLFKVCDHGSGGADTSCETFDGLKASAKAVKRATYGGLTFEVIDPATELRLTDIVDSTRTPVAPGSDGRAELFFPRAGMRVTLPSPAPAVEAHVMTFTGEPVVAEALDVQGQVVATARSSGAQRVPDVLTLQPRAGGVIAAVALTGGGGEAVLYKLCRLAAGTARRCLDFADAVLKEKTVAAFTHAQISFESVSGKPELSLVDRVNVTPDPDRSGRDQLPELQFGDSGLRIALPAACDLAVLKLMPFADAPIKAQALDATGARVWRGTVEGPAKTPQVVRIDGRGIRVIELLGGGQTVLYELCVERASGKDEGKDPSPAEGPVVVGASGIPQASPAVLAGRARADGTTTVTGIVADDPQDEWPGRVIDRRQGKDGRTCELVTFAPGRGRRGPWDGFRIEPPPGKVVTVVSACGIDQRAADARSNDVAVQAHLVGVLTGMVMASPEERREIVLAPDTEYEIAVTWRWQAWQPDSPDEQPPTPPATAWSLPVSDVLRFRTAPDSTLTAAVQDGLNECIFDARDIDRYLVAVEPADGRAVHFTGDPIWAHFDAGHVKQLLEQYQRDLAIEIRRTDPPPQPTAEALVEQLQPVTTVETWHELPKSMHHKGYERLNEMLADPNVAPCVPGGTPMGGASLAVTAALEPNAAYDLVVVAPRGDVDRPVVRATRFRTSRWASPRAFVAALGYMHPAVGPYLPDDLIVPEGMSLPAGGFVEGDAELDLTLAAIDAETLPLPTRTARSTVIWSFDSGGGWRVAGLLVDSLEPMRRDVTVVDAAGVPTPGLRITPLRAAVGASTLEPFRANARWTRVLFKPSSPVSLASATEHVLTLTFSTSDVGTVLGSRRLRAVPSILEREGL